MPDLGNLNQHLKIGNKSLINVVNYEYQRFYHWVTDNSYPIPNLIISSSFRPQSSGSHGKNLAIDIARNNTILAIDAVYLALFASWLHHSKFGKNLHIALARHSAYDPNNRHIHIDIEPSRAGLFRIEECRGKDNYYFIPMDKEAIFNHYLFNSGVDFKDKLKLMFESPGASSNVFQKEINNATEGIKSGFTIVKLSILAVLSAWLYNKIKGE